MNVDFPFHFAGNGRTAAADYADHIRDMVEQLLFTNPGERVNRPELGSGLQQMVFMPNSAEMAAALQFVVQSNLQQYLGELIDLDEVRVEADEATLSVTIVYVIRRTQERRVEEFERAL
ncbi:MAG TPA: GPW/gp25 family protein [Anaerolineae bacterium]|jgi:phage baseplate assembly protein W|nr:GPW/gp25 family protein [Anaerolineae bacterium]